MTSRGPFRPKTFYDSVEAALAPAGVRHGRLPAGQGVAVGWGGRAGQVPLLWGRLREQPSRVKTGDGTKTHGWQKGLWGGRGN